MILNILSGSFDWRLFLLRIPAVLIALSFHELSHAWAADKLGDPTARCYGRLSMNPARHFDPIGMISMVFFGVGWAKPVPINVNNFKDRKKGMALSGLAGPASNLLLCFIGCLLRRIAYTLFVLSGAATGFVLSLEIVILDFLFIFSMLNVYFAVFNLIPLPPFDGSRIFYFILPEKYYFSVMKYERIIMIAVLFAAFSGVLDIPLSAAANGIIGLFNTVIGWIPFL